MDELTEVVEPSLCEAEQRLRIVLHILARRGADSETLTDLRTALTRTQRVKNRIPETLAAA